MTDNEKILTGTLELAKEMGYSEVLAEYELGEDWQIRYSNSAQDIFKRWEANKINIFLVKDGKTTSIEVKSPSMGVIENKLKNALGYLEQSPKSQFYLGMEN